MWSALLDRSPRCSMLEVPGLTHDIQDLLNLIKELEERIIVLETMKRFVMDDDSWYWDH